MQQSELSDGQPNQVAAAFSYEVVTFWEAIEMSESEYKQRSLTRIREIARPWVRRGFRVAELNLSSELAGVSKDKPFCQVVQVKVCPEQLSPSTLLLRRMARRLRIGYRWREERRQGLL